MSGAPTSAARHAVTPLIVGVFYGLASIICACAGSSARSILRTSRASPAMSLARSMRKVASLPCLCPRLSRPPPYGFLDKRRREGKQAAIDKVRCRRVSCGRRRGFAWPRASSPRRNR